MFHRLKAARPHVQGQEGVRLPGYHCLVKRCYICFIHMISKQLNTLADESDLKQSRKFGLFEDSRSLNWLFTRGLT